VSISVQAREQSKFEFSALLSACLEEIAQLGRGWTEPLDLSFLTVDDLMEANNLQPQQPQLQRFWAETISFRKAEWQDAARIRFPV